MRILHLVDSLEVGGAETVVASLCRLHVSMAHLTAVHCLFAGGPISTALKRDGIEISVHGTAHRIHLIARLFQRIRELQPDVIHCHNAYATTVGAPAARLVGVPAVIATRHDNGLPPVPGSNEATFWLAARLCDRIVAVSPAAYRSLAAAKLSTPQKLVTVENGVRPAPAPCSPFAVIPGKSEFTVASVARLVPNKDQATLLRAIGLANRHIHGLSLLLVGDGPDRDALRRLSVDLGIDRRVHFLGQRPDVGNCLSTADLFVLSSIREGLPLSLLEAMAAGVPAVVTAVGGMPDIVALSGAGLTVPSRNPEAMASAIVSLARQPDLRRHFAERGRRCYLQHFTLERMADAYLRLYTSTLHANRNRSRLARMFRSAPKQLPEMPSANTAVQVDSTRGPT